MTTIDKVARAADMSPLAVRASIEELLELLTPEERVKFLNLHSPAGGDGFSQGSHEAQNVSASRSGGEDQAQHASQASDGDQDHFASASHYKHEGQNISASHNKGDARGLRASHYGDGGRNCGAGQQANGTHSIDASQDGCEAQNGLASQRQDEAQSMRASQHRNGAHNSGASRPFREAPNVSASQPSREAHNPFASRHSSDVQRINASHRENETHGKSTSQRDHEAQVWFASQVSDEAHGKHASHGVREAQNASAPVSLSSMALLVKTFYLIQKERIQTSNRIIQLSKLCKHRRGIRAEKKTNAEVFCTLRNEWVKVKECARCESFNPMISEGEAQYLHRLVDSRLRIIEKDIAHDLKIAIRRYDITGWALAVRGIGPILTAALIATIRDPARFENPSKLWKYFGLDVVDGKARRRRRGEKMTWNPFAKVLAWKIGESFVKKPGFFRQMYLEEKEKAKEKHPDWTKGHVHNHAKRVVAKRFLALFLIKWRRLKGLENPKPYPVAILGHSHVLDPDEVSMYDGKPVKKVVV